MRVGQSEQDKKLQRQEDFLFFFSTNGTKLTWRGKVSRVLSSLQPVKQLVLLWHCAFLLFYLPLIFKAVVVVQISPDSKNGQCAKISSDLTY